MSWVAAAVAGGSLIGAGASIYSGNKSAETSKEAAALQDQRQQEAIARMAATGAKAQGDFGDLAQSYNPWIAGGTGAYNQYLTGLGLGGGDPSAVTAAYRSQPGYQSGLDTGLNAVMRGTAASGHGLDSGRTMKSLYRFGSDYENTRFGDYMNRLMGVGNLGYSATGAKVGTQGAGINANVGAQTGANQSAYNAAGTIPMGMVAGAQAQNAGLQSGLNNATYLGGMYLGGQKPAYPWAYTT